MNLQGKTIVVTGCCSGIGSDFAKLARLNGARVIGVDRNDPSLTLDGFVKADLGDAAAIDAAVKQLPERIDALANIAGVPGTSRRSSARSGRRDSSCTANSARPRASPRARTGCATTRSPRRPATSTSRKR